MSQAKDSDSAENSLFRTQHDRVYYKEHTLFAGRGEFEVACTIADAIPDVLFLVSMGPFRGYNVKYEILQENVVLLDFYSVRPEDDFDPDEVIQDIEKGLANADNAAK